jgi:hypothetical protein
LSDAMILMLMRAGYGEPQRIRGNGDE